jgi:DNA-directed RNA polymerase specialized sigma24 family protein
MVDTVDFTETEYRVASGVAKRILRAQRNFIEYDDVVQECHLWMVKNPQRVVTWRDEGKKGKAKLSTALYRAGMRFVVRERCKRTSTQPSDHAFYSEALLHDIMPDVLDEESWAMAAHYDDTEGRAPSRPGEGNTRLAMIVDVKFAYDSLSEDDRNLLADRFADGGMDVAAIAAVRQVHESTIRRKIKNTLRKLSDRLGGEPPWM